MLRSLSLVLALTLSACGGEDDALTTDGLSDRGGSVNAPAAVQVEAVTEDPTPAPPESIRPLDLGLAEPDGAPGDELGRDPQPDSVVSNSAGERLR